MSRRPFVLLVLCAALAVSFVAPAAAQTLPWQLKIEKVLDNSAELGNIAQSPTGELWLLERAGNVRVLLGGVQKATLAIGVTTTCQGGLLDVAFAPDYASSGTAYVYYVDGSNKARVDTVKRTAAGLSLGSLILDLGPAGDDCRPGGGLSVGKDGKLYVATGDLASPASAQSDTSNLGKVLRANLDGGIPSDNASGTLVWAKGFRNPHGLAYNPNTARVGGTFYVSDVGATSPAAADEINQVKAGGNYAWSNGSGTMGGSYTDPLTSWASTGLVNPTSVASLYRPALGRVNSLAYALPNSGTNGLVQEMVLKGTELDQLDKTITLFNPVGDLDGTPDTQCPSKVNVVEAGGEGELYMANTGNNKAIWRIWRDTPGPREVSPTGSPFPFTVEKSGSNLKLVWENLGSLDAGLAKRHASSGQPANAYQVYEGALPLTGTYSHAQILDTAGAVDSGINARLTATVTPASGNRYYLIGAQGDNIFGSLGAASSGTQRTRPTTDFCDSVGRGIVTGKCAREFSNEVTGAVVKLEDMNPNSATYKQMINLSDLRGKILKLALTSENCFWCTVEAGQEDTVDKQYRDRDFLFVSVFTVNYGIWNVFKNSDDLTDPTSCGSHIKTWATNYNTKTPIVCDVDLDGNGYGDVSNFYDQCNCAPQNFYVDKGGIIYNYIQGAQFSSDVITNIQNEVSPADCN